MGDTLVVMSICRSNKVDLSVIDNMLPVWSPALWLHPSMTINWLNTLR